MKTDDVKRKLGSYEEKQLHSKDKLIAWSHRSRFETAIRLIARHSGPDARLLDFGCGDGTFLNLAQEHFGSLTGADYDQKQLNDCAERYSTVPKLRFIHSSRLSEAAYHSGFDVITCMEVLEHCTPSQVDDVLGTISRSLKPQGRLLISVPVEIGPSLLIKQVVRALAGLRNIGDYRYLEKYTSRELLRMLLADEGSEIPRPVYEAKTPAGERIPYHGHKGFNWKSFKRRLSRDFTVTDQRFSPIGALNGAFGSQVWFECVK